LVEGNTIAGNHADGPAGGVELPGEGVTLLRNIIVDNRSDEFADGIMVQRTAALLCNDVWGNGEEDYWGTEPGEGDFSADPLFCGDPGPDMIGSADEDPGRYDLRSDSPCLPGQHPEGIDCGLIGARPEGCDRRSGFPPIVTDPERRTIRVWPNPIQSDALIRLEGPRNDRGAPLTIVDASGRAIAELKPISPGLFQWDGCLRDGSRAAAGFYFVRRQARGSPPESATILVVR
jgi:hypothetical protein